MQPQAELRRLRIQPGVTVVHLKAQLKLRRIEFQPGFAALQKLQALLHMRQIISKAVHTAIREARIASNIL